MSISKDEWLKALDEAGLGGVGVDDQDAVTVLEFSEMLDISRCTAERRLKQLVELGRAVATTKRVRVGGNARRLLVQAYKLT